MTTYTTRVSDASIQIPNTQMLNTSTSTHPSPHENDYVLIKCSHTLKNQEALVSVYRPGVLLGEFVRMGEPRDRLHSNLRHILSASGSSLVTE